LGEYVEAKRGFSAKATLLILLFLLAGLPTFLFGYCHTAFQRG